MKPKPELFQLIKSLSKTEKTYFKKFASRHYKENNTLTKLFDELDKKKSNGNYSEEDIKQKFKKEKFIKQLPVTKNYLYNNILKSLNLYYTEDNDDLKLNLIINNAAILYQKELFTHSLKEIKRAKLLAQKLDKLPKLLEAIHIERKALRVISSLNETERELMKNYNEEREVLDKLKNICEYRNLYDKMVILATAKGTSAGSGNSTGFEVILNDPLLKNFNNAKYFQSKAVFLLMHCFINNLTGDINKAYKYGKQCLELVGESQENKYIAVYEYLLILQEMMTISHYLGKYGESQLYFENLYEEENKLLKYTPKKVRNFLVMRTLTCKINLNSSLGKFEDNLPVISSLLKYYDENIKDSYRDEIIVTDFIVAATYFSIGRYDDSIYYINRISNSKAFELREDIQVSYRIFNLILHYELGHMGSLEYYVRSTFRYLKKLNKLSRFENLLFSFLKQSQHASNEKEMKQLFIETREKLNLYSDEEPPMLKVINLDAWLESKIEKRKYSDVVKKQIKL